MITIDAPQRFTLIKEYFGGIIHDAKEIFCEILMPEEFKLLADLKAGKEFSAKELERMSDGLRKKVEILLKKGAIVISDGDKLSLVNTRLIPPPVSLKEGCLTAPIRVYDIYTRRCNLNCKHCSVSSSATVSETRRTLEETEIIMRKFYEAGTMEWRFSGGEPTSCPDLLDAISIAKGFGMAVMLNTNGCWNENMFQRIPDSGVDEIIISLEGREEVNDKRRNPGVFKQIIRALDRIAQHNQEQKDRKIKVTLNMTIALDNVGEVEFVVRLGASYGYNINFLPLRPYGRTLTELQGAMLSTEEFMRFSENVQRLREDPQIRESGIKIIHRNMDLFCPDYPDRSFSPFPFNYSDCGALSTGFGLGPDGRVNACGFLMDDPEFVGPNMLEVSVYDAWLHPSMEHSRRAEKVGCTDCQFYMKQCQGKCRAMVIANKGRIENNKLIGRDPYCFAALMRKKEKK